MTFESGLLKALTSETAPCKGSRKKKKKLSRVLLSRVIFLLKLFEYGYGTD